MRQLTVRQRLPTVNSFVPLPVAGDVRNTILGAPCRLPITVLLRVQTPCVACRWRVGSVSGFLSYISTHACVARVRRGPKYLIDLQQPSTVMTPCCYHRRDTGLERHLMLLSRHSARCARSVHAILMIFNLVNTNGSIDFSLECIARFSCMGNACQRR